MLHYIVRYTNDAGDSPVLAELARLGVPYRCFARYINMRYQNPFGLVLRVYPRLFGFAVTSAVRSLLLSRPAPDTIVIGTDVEALVFGLLRLILRRRTLIVYETIILQQRAGVAGGLFHAYYSRVLSLIGLGVCHSRQELDRYAALYPGARAKLVVIPFATTLAGRDVWLQRSAAHANDTAANGYIAAAGRSGRDYATLVSAMVDIPCKLKIICDTEAPLAGIALPPNVEILRDCFGDAYLETLAHSLFVVVPLQIDDVSAGQMVLLQAAGMQKAVIITRTSTTGDYATHQEDALLVDRGDAVQLRQAIETLLGDPAERQRIAANATARFLRDHGAAAYASRLLAAIRANPMP